MINCDYIEEHLFKIAEGDIDKALRADVDRHLESCDSCRELITEFKAVLAVPDNTPEIEPSVNFLPRLNARLDELEEAHKVRTPLGVLARVLRPVATAAMLAVTVFLGYSFGKLSVSATGAATEYTEVDPMEQYSVDALSLVPEVSIASFFFEIPEEPEGDES